MEAGSTYCGDNLLLWSKRPGYPEISRSAQPSAAAPDPVGIIGIISTGPSKLSVQPDASIDKTASRIVFTGRFMQYLKKEKVIYAELES